MANIAVPLTVSNTQYPANRGAMTLGDAPLSTATFKSISGRVKDRNDENVVGATVMLFRQRDDLMVAKMLSNAQGLYMFNRRSDDTAQYYTLAYTLAGGSTQVHGTSDRGMVPS